MRDKRTPDYYGALRLTVTANATEIRRQYRVLSKQFHPDKGGSHEDMARINEAYSVLSDPFRRSLYDAERRRALRVPPRMPEQPAHTPPRRQPTAPTTQFATTPKARRRTNWWEVLAWSFAAIVIVIGILTQLPLAEAKGDTATSPATLSQPLTINYPSDSDNSTNQTSNSYDSPNSTSYDTPAVAPTGKTSTPSQNTTCSDSDCPIEQSQLKKSCVTKTFGLYRRIICSSPDGGKLPEQYNR